MGALLAVQPLLSPCTAVPGSHVAEQLSQHCGPGSPCAGHQLVALASMRVLGPSRSSVSTLPCPSSAGATRCMSLHPSLLPLAQNSQDAAPCTTCCFPALPTPLVFVRQDVMGHLAGVDSNRLSWGAGSLLRRAGMWQGGAAPCSLLVWEADQDRTDLLGPQDPVQPHGVGVVSSYSCGSALPPSASPVWTGGHIPVLHQPPVSGLAPAQPRERSQRTECQEGARSSHSPARGRSTVGTHGPANPRCGPQSNPSMLRCPRSQRGAVSQQHSAEAPCASEPSTAGDLRHGTRTKRKPINYTCADCIWRTVLRLSDTKSLDPPARPSAYALWYSQV